MADRGIYRIVGKAKGRIAIYVGSTHRSFDKRFRQHRTDLRTGKHHSPCLQRLWDKYGGKCLSFEVIETIDDVNQIHQREQWWIDHYRGLGVCCNTVLVVGKPMLGRHHSEATRKKMSKSRMGHPMLESVRQALIRANTGRKGVSHTALWRKRTLKANCGRKRTDLQKQQVADAQAGAYPAFINLTTGEIIPSGSNLSALSRERGFIMANMWAMVHGKRNKHHGWSLLGRES